MSAHSVDQRCSHKRSTAVENIDLGIADSKWAVCFARSRRAISRAGQSRARIGGSPEPCRRYPRNELQCGALLEDHSRDLEISRLIASASPTDTFATLCAESECRQISKAIPRGRTVSVLRYLRSLVQESGSASTATSARAWNSLDSVNTKIEH